MRALRKVESFCTAKETGNQPSEETVTEQQESLCLPCV